MKKYDVCVIGSGPGGFAAAMRAYDFGLKVCILEGGEIGGAGIVGGALTSKSLWELSKDYSGACAVDRGYRASGLSLDYEEVMDTVVSAAKEKQYQILSQVESFRTGAKSKGKLDLIRAYGKFKSDHVISYSGKDGEGELEAKDVILATGSKPRVFPGIDTDGERIINSDHIMSLKSFPKRLMIIGAGIIGCEFATIFSNFKQTEVHLLDHSQRVIPFEDDDVSDFVSKNLSDAGVIVHHEANLRRVKKTDDYIEVTLDYQDGHAKVIEVDVVLLSIGRVPNTQSLGLEKVGIDLTERGLLTCDHQCRVKDHIYAVGDISGNAALVNVAELEGRYAAKAISGDTPHALRYSNMSTIMFFKPEVASVGMNEKQCREKKIPYRVVHYSNALVNRAIAMRSTNGFVKIIVNYDKDPKILGMRAAGPQSSASIMCIALLMDQDKGIQEIMKTTHPHPSITEGIQESLRVLEGKSIFKPEAFPEFIQVKSWKP